MDSTRIHKSASHAIREELVTSVHQYQATTNANRFANGALARVKAAMTPAFAPVMA